MTYSLKLEEYVSLHVFVRFEPKPAHKQQLREELLRVLPPTREEEGCRNIHLYETKGDPFAFLFIPSGTMKQPSTPTQNCLT